MDKLEDEKINKIKKKEREREERKKKIAEWERKSKKWDLDEQEWFRQADRDYSKRFEELDIEAENVKKRKKETIENACIELEEEARTLKRNLTLNIAATGLALSQVPVLPYTASSFALIGAGDALNTVFSIQINKKKQEKLNCKAIWDKKPDSSNSKLNKKRSYYSPFYDPETSEELEL